MRSVAERRRYHFLATAENADFPVVKHSGTPAFKNRLRPSKRLSSTVMFLNSARFWNVRAMPLRAIL